MSDGIVIAPSAPLPQKSAADIQPAKILSLPPGIVTNKPISGEVVANDKGVVTIKTDQGLIVVEAQIEAEPGQTINLRLQNVMQQGTQRMTAEILAVLSGKTPVVPAPTTQNPASIPADAVIVPNSKSLAEYTPLQAKMVSLPIQLSDEALQITIKSLLNLSPTTPLPQTLKEGLEKFQQLVGLLGQANLLPNQTMTPVNPGNESKNSLLSALQQIFKNQNGILTAQPGQNFIQLQSVPPGQAVSPNILVQIRQQLLTILQQQPISQNASPAASTPPQELSPLYTMPAIGLTLGQQSTTLPTMKNANLMMLITPQGQQLIGLVSPQSEGQRLLPGTVTVMAFQPQAQKIMTLPMVPLSGTVDELTALAPLNLSLGDGWPVLDEIFDQALAHQALQPEFLNALRQILPMPHVQQMPPAVLLFVALLKNNMAGEWLGDNIVKQLEKIGKADLIKQLSGDLRLIQSGMDDVLPADAWRPLPIPLQIADQLVRLQFFYRHPDDGASSNDDTGIADKKKRKTRFLLNVPKTAMGDIQIDGLVQEKDLEMILRTERQITAEIEGEIRSRYQAVLETTGMSGGINFQSGMHHYVRA